ncbi:MAG TPA: CocE/NonD family hydrolase [Methanoregulaceae archaeon]|nr:CocE/NonD family hydrolase [Methanoregulaceae archaeon]
MTIDREEHISYESLCEIKDSRIMDEGMRIAGAIVERDVVSEMRDGTLLAADVYRPASGEGPWPVLVIRQPYDKAHSETFSYAHPSWYASRGYIVVSQDIRGRWASGGEFSPFRHEAEDGYDTVEWAAALSGSSGKVGMYGFSYGGLTQLVAASLAPPHLTCICPAFCTPHLHEGWAYNGGAFALAFNLTWAMYLSTDTARRKGLSGYEATLWKSIQSMHDWWQWLPMDSFPLLRAHDLAPFFFEWIDHPENDAYWQRWSIERVYSRIMVPAMHIGGWYDIFRDGDIRLFGGLKSHAGSTRARENQKLVMGPWYHSPWTSILGPCDLGEAAANRIDDLQLKWFDHWLKGMENRIMDEPRVRYYMLGENTWRDDPSWPPEKTRLRTLYLHSGGRANSLSGNGFLSSELPEDESTDVYVYNPRDPIPSLGGQSCCMTGITPMGPADQRQVEAANQVLVYTTPPLEVPFCIAGNIAVLLWISTDVPDTDLCVKLVDVSPGGRAINLTSGILRAKFRDSLENPSLLSPGTVYSLNIDGGSTAALIRRDHRIRLEVSGSNFPCWDRNTNTGNNPMKDTYADIRVATVQVFHERRYPSCLALPGWEEP